MTNPLSTLRKDPFEGMTPYGLTFGRWFDDMLGRTQEDGGQLLTPALDITEDENEFRVTTELPGLTKDDVQIQLENGVLAISGEKKQETESKGKSWHRMERRYGAFYRSITLPRGDGARLRLLQGLLRLLGELVEPHGVLPLRAAWRRGPGRRVRAPGPRILLGIPGTPASFTGS